MQVFEKMCLHDQLSFLIGRLNTVRLRADVVFNPHISDAADLAAHAMCEVVSVLNGRQLCVGLDSYPVDKCRHSCEANE